MTNVELMFNMMSVSDSAVFPYELTQALVQTIRNASQSVHRASAVEWIVKVILNIVVFPLCKSITFNEIM